jgi:hypothetical protein
MSLHPLARIPLAGLEFGILQWFVPPEKAKSIPEAMFLQPDFFNKPDSFSAIHFAVVSDRSLISSDSRTCPV